MNPREFDPDITRIVDELRAAGGTVTGIYIVRADGQTIGKPPEPMKGALVSGLCDVAVALKKFGPGKTLR